MKTASKKNASSSAEGSSSFPVPFMIEEFRTDITNVVFQYLREVSWVFGEPAAWSLIKTPANPERGDLKYLASDATSAGLAYEDVRDTAFAQVLERLYFYAYFGRVDDSAPGFDSFECETIYTLFSGLVCDALNTSLAGDWNNFDPKNYAAHCVLVAETANARFTLEGGMPFFDFQGIFDSPDQEQLTFRQMALLSGMEEASIRAAAIRTRQNALPTVSTDNGTRIELPVALSWLQAKNRYIPITHFCTAGDIDLAKRRFLKTSDLLSVLHDRYCMLTDRDGQEVINARAVTAGLEILCPGESFATIPLDVDRLIDHVHMRAVAVLLELPEELLILRSQETWTRERLLEIEYALREAVQGQDEAPTHPTK